MLVQALSGIADNSRGRSQKRCGGPEEILTNCTNASHHGVLENRLNVMLYRHEPELCTHFFNIVGISHIMDTL